MLPVPVVCLDHNNRSCIVVQANEKKVFAIVMATSLEITQFSSASFFGRFSPTDFPVRRAAEHYLVMLQYGDSSVAAKKQLESIAKGLKANQLTHGEAMDLMSKTHILDISGKVIGPATTLATLTPGNKEFEMATKKAAVAVEKKAPAKAAKAEAVEKKAPVKAAKVEAAPKEKKVGVTQFMMDCILEGMETEEIVMAIQEQFPESRAGKKEISWCRSKLRKDGKIK
jgi:hypothetical protein